MSDRRRLWQSIPLLATFLTLILLASLMLVQPRESGVAVTRGSRLLVADFSSGTTDSSPIAGLKELLQITLEQSKQVQPLPEAAVQDALRRLGKDPRMPVTPELARQICIREGLHSYLEPRITEVGNSLIMSARLVVADGGRFNETQVDMVRVRDDRDLLPAVDEFGKQVRKSLGESDDSLAATGASLPAYAAANAQALQLFARALSLRRKMDYEGEIRLLERAAASDPNFALAQMLLARRYAFLGRQESASACLRAAKEHATSLPPYYRHQILGTCYSRADRFPEALREWQALQAIYPGAGIAHAGIAQTALLMGKLPMAVQEYQNAVRLDEWQIDAQLGLCYARLLNRNPAGARNAWEMALALEPESPDVICTGGLVDLVENNLVSALRAFQKVRLRPPGPIRSYATFLLAQAQIYGGRFESAVETLRSGIESDEQQGDVDSASAKRLALCQVRLLQGEGSAALAECASVPPPGNTARMSCLGAIYARLGHPAEARELLNRIQQTLVSPSARAQAEMLRGEVDLAEGHPREAVVALTKAKELDPSGAPLEALARARALAGEWVLSAEEYQAVCERKAEVLFPATRPWFTGTWVRALFDAGQCLEKLDRKPEAQQYYRSYVWVLAGADRSVGSLPVVEALLKQRYKRHEK